MFRQNKARKLRIPILSHSISQDSGKQELKKGCSQIIQWFLEKRQGNRWRRKKIFSTNGYRISYFTEIFHPKMDHKSKYKI